MTRVDTPVDALKYLHEIAVRAVMNAGANEDGWEQVGPRFMAAVMKIYVMAGYYADRFAQPPQ